jgi:hypothetical protein
VTGKEIVDEARVIINMLSEEGGTSLRHDACRTVLSPRAVRRATCGDHEDPQLTAENLKDPSDWSVECA